MNGAEQIVRERLDQITGHGRTLEHDDTYQNNELARAAACILSGVDDAGVTYPMPPDWPWDLAWWNRIMDHTPEERLVRAGALLAAEIDRRQRL